MAALDFADHKYVVTDNDHSTEDGWSNWYQIPDDGIGVISFSVAEYDSEGRTHKVGHHPAIMHLAATSGDNTDASDFQTGFEGSGGGETFDLSYESVNGAVANIPLPFGLTPAASTNWAIRFSDSVSIFIYQPNTSADTLTEITS